MNRKESSTIVQGQAPSSRAEGRLLCPPQILYNDTKDPNKTRDNTDVHLKCEKFITHLWWSVELFINWETFANYIRFLSLSEQVLC